MWKYHPHCLEDCSMSKCVNLFSHPEGAYYASSMRQMNGARTGRILAHNGTEGMLQRIAIMNNNLHCTTNIHANKMGIVVMKWVRTKSLIVCLISLLSDMKGNCFEN